MASKRTVITKFGGNDAKESEINRIFLCKNCTFLILINSRSFMNISLYPLLNKKRKIASKSLAEYVMYFKLSMLYA